MIFSTLVIVWKNLVLVYLYTLFTRNMCICLSSVKREEIGKTEQSSRSFENTKIVAAWFVYTVQCTWCRRNRRTDNTRIKKRKEKMNKFERKLNRKNNITLRSQKGNQNRDFMWMVCHSKTIVMENGQKVVRSFFLDFDKLKCRNMWDSAQ